MMFLRIIGYLILGDKPCRKSKPIVLLQSGLKEREPGNLFSQNLMAVIF
jgi:hypothetical protein